MANETTSPKRPATPQYVSDATLERALNPNRNEFLASGVSYLPDDKERLREAWGRLNNREPTPYDEVEHLLGVKNFKREFLGMVRAFSTFDPINPHKEPLDDPATFNTRFARLASGMKAVWAAAGDIAIRDRRYMETFFSGYTNPIISQTHLVKDKTTFQAIPTFDNNGNPLDIVDQSWLVFNVDALTRLELTNVYPWVFVNGRLLDKKWYKLHNTAFGTKVYIAPTEITDNDRVEIVINRIFNESKDCITYDIEEDTSDTIIKFFNADRLGAFYNHKYIKVYVRRAPMSTTVRPPSADENGFNSGAEYALLDKNSEVWKNGASFFELERKYYDTEVDDSGMNVKLMLRGFEFMANDKIYVMNSVYYYEHEEEFHALGDDMITEFPLMENVSGDIRPIPYGSIEDFDVFLDGYHLTPGKHFYVVKGGSGASPNKLVLLYRPTKANKHKICIYKNESVIDDQDVSLVRSETIPAKGLLKSSNNNTLPLMPRLGHTFVGGLYQPNSSLKHKFRRLMHVSGINAKLQGNPRIEYRAKIVNTLDTNHVTRFMCDNLSEYDLVGEWLGVDRIINELFEGLPVTESSDNNVRYGLDHPEAKDDIGLELVTIETSAIEQLRGFIKYFHDNNINRPLILDSNVFLSQHQIPMNLIGSTLVLDSNDMITMPLVLNSNYLFENPYQNPMSESYREPAARG